jgi:hypothetical protein
MKFTRLLTQALVVTILSFNAQAQNTGPLLWTSFIEVVGNYLHSDSEGIVVSRFTPGVAITVTRVQLQAAFGSSYMFSKTKCREVPKIRVTDGTTKYALAIPNARGRGADPLSVSADSGPIKVIFPTNAALRLSVGPGETGCNAASINVTVQYSVN